MTQNLRPSERLTGHSLKGWQVISLIDPPTDEKDFRWWTPCYVVTKDGQKGFLKAFDFTELQRAGGEDKVKLVQHKFDMELSMLRKCKEQQIKTVVELLDHGTFFFDEHSGKTVISYSGGSVDQRVNYFILEYCEDGDMLKSLQKGNLAEFGAKFQALIDIINGLIPMHEQGIVHLDLKSENVIHFIQERITKITDFGSARMYMDVLDENMQKEVDAITTTHHFAPPECLYEDYWVKDWDTERKKIDLYLMGSIIVRMFTTYTFTALLRMSLSEGYDWDRNKGKLKECMPVLVAAASKVYRKLKIEIMASNESCGRPLTDDQIVRLAKTVAQLCNPIAEERGHPVELAYKNGNDGLYRYRDQFITMRDACLAKLRK